MRKLSLILAIALTSCVDVNAPTPEQVVQATLPGCRVTLCDADCQRCATHVPENENPACDVVLCGELAVDLGDPGSCPVVIISQGVTP